MTPPDALLTEAVALHQAGNLDKAESIYRAILERDPRNADALNLLGVAATQRGRLDEAIALLSQAHGVRPNHPVVLLNLGNAFRGRKQFDDARNCYEEAIRLTPDYADAHCNLGLVCVDQGDFPAAAQSLERAVALSPDHVEASFALADLRLKQGDETAGAVLLGRLASAGGLTATSMIRIAAGFLKLGALDKAESLYLRAVAAAPSNPDAHNGLGLVYYNQGRLLDALTHLKKSAAIAPAAAAPWHNMAAALIDLASPYEAEQCFMKAVAAAPSDHHAHSYLCYCLNFLHDRQPAAVFAAHVEWAKKHALGLAPERPAPLASATADRIRLGYVSGDFRVHSVAFFAESFLANHDKQQFEVYCYSDCRRPDAVTARFRGYADAWRDIAGMPDEAVARQVTEDGIDILVDLAGHTRENRLLVFARKAAPVQVTYLGYPNTTGISAIDFRITDRVADPPGSADGLHTEKLLRLPGPFLCYTPPAGAPAVAPAPRQTNGYITFGCFNNLAKTNPVTVGLWTTLLNSVADSHLLLKARPFNDPRVVDRWKALFTAGGIDPHRLEFTGRVGSLDDHLAHYGRVDIALDTFPYNGTTTTLEALWMGVPVVSLSGTVHASRVGASILSSLGLFDLCADVGERYVARAAALAANPGELHSLRSTLRDRLKESSLCNAPQFTGRLETAYRSMLDRASSAS